MNDSQILSNCPFCGGEVELTTYRNEGYIIKCNNHDWPKAEGFHPIADENIAGDIQLCSWGLGDEAKKALITAWNTRDERTCEPTEEWCCDHCGADLIECNVGVAAGGGAYELDPPILVNYCPNCGARVIEVDNAD